MNKAIRFVAIVSMAAALGGCQSFPLTSWMFKRPAANETRASLAANTTGALEEGKSYLRHGNLSGAVASFRIALLDPSAFGEANNGLAVAYAKLGRADLAERYFRAAITAEPENTKFVANLLRLQQQVMLARGRDIPVPEMQPPPVLASRDALAGPAQRVSRAEVMVRSQSEGGAAPSMAVIYRDAMESEDAAKLAAHDERLAAAVGGQSMTVVFGE